MTAPSPLYLNPTGKNRNVKLAMSFQSPARLHAWIWRPWVCPSLCMSDAASKCVVAGFSISCILQTLIMDLSYCVPTGLPHRSVIDGRNAGGEPEPTCHSRAKHEGNLAGPLSTPLVRLFTRLPDGKAMTRRSMRSTLNTWHVRLCRTDETVVGLVCHSIACMFCSE